MVIAVGVGHRLWIRVPGETFREITDLRFDGVVPIDDFARVGGHAAQDRSHGTVGSILGLIVRLIVSNGIEQVVVFLLVRVLGALFLEAPCAIAIQELHRISADVAGAFGPDGMFGDVAPAAKLVAALAETP